MSSKKKRRLRVGRLLFVSFIFLLILILLFTVGVFGYYKYRTSTSGDMNIVVLGVDGREATEGSSRADSVMLVHVDKDTAVVSTISLPRDSLVYIPCEEENDKLTHAYSYGETNWADKGGGRVCTMESVRGVFELDELDNYMQVDFDKMIALVDDIGGIDMTPTSTFCEMDENDNSSQYCFEEGVSVHMNGAMALSYARHRYSDSDIYRAQRQQDVVKAMAMKAKSLPLLDLYRFANKALSSIDTNLSINDLIGYADLILEKDLIVEQEVVEGSDDWVYEQRYDQEIYYYVLDPTNLDNIIKKLK